MLHLEISWHSRPTHGFLFCNTVLITWIKCDILGGLKRNWAWIVFAAYCAAIRWQSWNTLFCIALIQAHNSCLVTNGKYTPLKLHLCHLSACTTAGVHISVRLQISSRDSTKGLRLLHTIAKPAIPISQRNLAKLKKSISRINTMQTIDHCSIYLPYFTTARIAWWLISLLNREHLYYRWSRYAADSTDDTVLRNSILYRSGHKDWQEDSG